MPRSSPALGSAIQFANVQSPGPIPQPHESAAVRYVNEQLDTVVEFLAGGES